MDSSLQEQMAAFRYSLIAPIVSRQTPLAPGELKAYLAQAASQVYHIPGSTKTHVSVRSLERWLNQYRRGEWNGLKPKARIRKTNLGILPVVLQEAIRLRKERPERSVEQIVFLLEESGTSEAGSVAASTRLAYGTTSSPYYKAYQYKQSANHREYWKPSRTYGLGIRRLYYRWRVRGQVGRWLAVQPEGNPRGKELFVRLWETVPPERRFVYGKVPAELQAELLLREAERMCEETLNEMLPSLASLYRLEQLLREAMSLDSTCFTGERVYLWEKLAFQWAAENKLHRAADCFRAQSALQPGDGGPFLNMGFHYCSSGMKKEAMSAYLEGLKIDPKDEYLLHNLANLYAEMGSRKKALAAINEAILKNPSLPSIYKLKGDLHTQWGEPEAALQCYRQALSLCTEGWESVEQDLVSAVNVH